MAKQAIDSKHVDRLKKGDMEAFEYIYNYYKESIYYFSLSFLKNNADAEEVVQETFIQVLKSVKSLQKNNSFHSWIHKIAYHCSMAVYKKNVKLPTSEGEYSLDNIIESDDNTTTNYEKRELFEAVKQEIEKLSPKLLSVAQLRYYDDLNVDEISEVLDIPRGTVKTRLKSIREKMQPILKRKGYTPAKYFSFAFGPLIVKVMKALVEVNTLSSESSAAIYNRIIHTDYTVQGALVSGGLLGGLALGGVKVVGVFLIVGISGYSLYEVNTPPQSEVEEIRYYDQATNKNIQVEVLLNDGMSEEDIHISFKEKEMKFNKIDKLITFEVSENGTYKIKAKNETKVLEIQNIDKQHPELNDISYEEKKLKLSIKDLQSGVDYEKSEVVYNDKTRKISLDGIVSDVDEGEVKVLLYDKVGNMSEYTIGIHE